jgi:DNA-binding transcriptional MerR regulator
MKKKGEYSISELARLAGVSLRTLRYYDQVGLLHPSARESNGYRRYRQVDLLRLQQILYYRELGFPLTRIQVLLDDPHFDLLTALAQHQDALQAEQERITTLIQTIQNTIAFMKGNNEMTDNELFTGFSEEKQAEYEKYAEAHWDPKLVQQSSARWKALSKEGKQALMADGSRITLAIAKTIPLGPGSPETQALIADWHAYINRFYDCSLEILLGLGNTYSDHPEFRAVYEKVDPAMPAFFTKAIRIYCKDRGVNN